MNIAVLARPTSIAQRACLLGRTKGETPNDRVAFLRFVLLGPDLPQGSSRLYASVKGESVRQQRQAHADNADSSLSDNQLCDTGTTLVLVLVGFSAEIPIRDTER